MHIMVFYIKKKNIHYNMHINFEVLRFLTPFPSTESGGQKC